MAEKKAEKKVFDIAQPGKGKVDIGSKPMVVGHRSMASDPMMRNDLEGDKQFDLNTEKVSQSSKITITPISDEETENQDDGEIKESQDQAADQKETVDVEDTTEDIANKKGDKKEDESASSDESAISGSKDAEDEDDSDKKPEEDKKLDPTAVAMERDENLRKLIDNKTYRLDIKESSSSEGKSRKIVVTLVAVLAGLIGLFVAIDTKALDIGVDLPFSVFGKDSTNNTETPASTPEPAAEQPSESTKPSESKKSELTKPLEFSFETPEDWSFSYSDKTLDAFGVHTYTYTLSNGTKLVLEPYGGKGGDCQPESTDIPHQAGNKCETTELLSSEDIKLTDATQSKLSKDTKLALQKYRITDRDGNSEYFLCLDDIETSYTELAVGEPYMGFGLQRCAGIGVITLVLKILGPDNKTEDFFKDQDVMEIEKVFATFELL